VANLVPVAKTVDCNRCGEGPLAWVKNKNGRWYLARAYKNGDELVAAKLQWHKCEGNSKEVARG
jgi:hypothetical protein